MDNSARALRARLEHGEANAMEVVGQLTGAPTDAPPLALRLDACRLLGGLAGRALGADWDAAERAAFALLEAARVADTAADRRGVIAAMGRGFRNLWLLPFVHRRLSDLDATIAIAAIHVKPPPRSPRSPRFARPRAGPRRSRCSTAISKPRCRSRRCATSPR